MHLRSEIYQRTVYIIIEFCIAASENKPLFFYITPAISHKPKHNQEKCIWDLIFTELFWGEKIGSGSFAAKNYPRSCYGLDGLDGFCGKKLGEKCVGSQPTFSRFPDVADAGQTLNSNLSPSRTHPGIKEWPGAFCGKQLGDKNV